MNFRSDSIYKESMEGKSLCTSLKDHSIVSIRTSNESNKLKDSWVYDSQSKGEDYLDGFSWPPRSYSCSFCKREFRSAQALGGHMNVHRRDRAKLRQSPPMDGQLPIPNLNLNPNSYPNPSFSSPFKRTVPFLVSPPYSALPSPSFSSPSEIKKWAIDGELLDPLSPKASDLTTLRTRKSLFDAKEYDSFERQGGCNFLKKAEILRLDLEIGLLSEPKEDLDLELRLGYS